MGLFSGQYVTQKSFPQFFCINITQVAIQFSNRDIEVLRGLEGRPQEKVSDSQAELGAEMMGIRDALIAEMKEYYR